MGATVLAAEQGIEPRRLGYRADKALEIAHSQRLAHAVGVNGFFTALAGSARQRRAERAWLAVWLSERRCADRWGHVVRPDGYGRWHEHHRKVDFFLKYDLGTEPLARLAAKLYAYGDLADATEIPTAILFWLPTTVREATVRQALADETRWGTVPCLVATASPTLGHGPAEAAWLALGLTWPRRRLIDLDDVDLPTAHADGASI